jgi:DNA-binding transcriptional ArsR family regulator
MTETLEQKAARYKHLSEFFAVLANPDRLKILELLSQKQ